MNRRTGRLLRHAALLAADGAYARMWQLQQQEENQPATTNVTG